jgi:D-alanyl-D-alanine carboxypeptidase
MISFNKIICCVVIMFSLPVAASANIEVQLKKELIASLKEYDTPGAVFLLSSPKLGSLTLAAGVADKTTKKPMQVSNNFRLASMSKTFLAVTLLKLVEQGKLKLDDKILNLLPEEIEWNRIANGKELTVRQLLQMRSGIPNYTEYDAYENLVEEKKENGVWTLEECIAVIYDEKPNFVQDQGYEYSNTNYLLLQAIIENITQQPYGKVINEKIIKPLNLKNTFVEGQGNGVNDVINTHGYELIDEVQTDVTFLNDGFGLGDGGIISTAEDVNVFVQALLKTKTLLKPSTLQQMLDFKGDEYYGLGIYREEDDDGLEAWTHNGSSSGFSGQFYYLPEYQLTLVLLTNYFDTEMIEEFISEVTKQLMEKKLA